MSIKIWLDDVRPCPYIGWVSVKTVSAAKELFMTNEVDDASFDNDLAGGCNADCWEEIDISEGRSISYMTIPKCDEKTCTCDCHVEGYKLVDWLKETGKWPNKKPTVHSSNVARSTYMREIIDKHYGVDNVEDIFGKS